MGEMPLKLPHFIREEARKVAEGEPEEGYRESEEVYKTRQKCDQLSDYKYKTHHSVLNTKNHRR